MTDLRQAAQQALDAWDNAVLLAHDDLVQDRMDSLRTALEQQAEPVACVIDGDLYFHHEIDWEDLAYQGHEVKLLYTAPPQQQAEPVAWMDREGDLYKMPEIKNWAPPHVLLYATPPQRQWQGLTDEDFLEACQIAERGNYLLAFQRIQIKLKERNNG